MDSQQPVFGFLGDLNGALALQVRNDLHLTAQSNRAVAAQHGLLIDGKTAPAVDQSTLANVLDTGGVLAICSPTAEHASMLGKITGQTPAAGVPMVCFKKKSSAPARYKCVTVTGSQVTKRMRSDDDAPIKSTFTYVPELGPILASAAVDTTALGMAPAGFVPNATPDTYYGYQSKVTSGSWGLGYPEWNNGPWDDETAKSTSQNVSGQYLTEFFVYWANGVESNPYYVVIQRQSGPVSIGNVLANNSYSRGFFTIAWKASSSGVSINGATNPPGVVPGPHAPETGENNAALPVNFSTPIQIVGPTQSGTGNITFAASVQDTLDYSQWGILDQTGGGNAAWEGYQTAGWNPLLNPPCSDLYPNGNVIAMADQSFGAIDFETFTCWTFDSSLFTVPSGGNPFTPPPSLEVTFNFTYEQDVVFLHNHPGCSGNYNGHHFHIWEYDNPLNDSMTFDLGTVVSQQSMGPS